MAKARQVDVPNALILDSNRSYRNQPIHDDAEPAWMDDNETFGHEDPAIAAVPDNDLVHFVPGKDMIAAHRKDRNDGQRRDGNKPFVSFFGADQQAEPVKTPKAFNAADYLLPSRVPEERPEALEAPGAGFSSRFQKFFGALPPDPPARPYQTSPNPPNPATESRAPERVDDHMARLMGLLSAKVSMRCISLIIVSPRSSCTSNRYSNRATWLSTIAELSSGSATRVFSSRIPAISIKPFGPARRPSPS